ncbi:unnamed protein product [Adineta ricciae]|uniref:Peptidase C1A papain C-terminal domain-containing protein n=2 Tax=Adineta ricciae TaxID=249248 RepID=A0A815NFJ3_ADIRI|nr:unnamed protein product [Adineta ricciae]CAF1652789.1 unnamed protein product [Adineta ricciae]
MKVLAPSAAFSLIFLSNLHEIERHNAQVNRTYTKAVNQFSDFTQLEFETEILTPQLAFAPIPNPPPTSVQTRSSSSNPNACCSALGLGDWNRRQCSDDGRVNGVVTNGCVHHDSQCCRSSGNPSECCAALGFAWWDGEWCRGAHPAGGRTFCSTYLLIRLVSNGPVAIAINADFMGGYGGGVYRGPCPPHVNHAVLLTGWGTDAQTGVPFWRVKNSWGAGWGENGFARFERKPGENQCFIYHEVTRPTAI